jgi:adenosylmethionine-8-amino-7-oxononanoate aminotransferase
VVRGEVYDIFKENKEAIMGHLLTFGGHPAACAAALKNLDVFAEEDLVKLGAERGEYLRRQLQDLLAHPTVGDLRGLGMMYGIDLVKNKETREAWNKGDKFTARLGELALERGLVTRVWDVMHFAPPLVIENDEIDRMVAIADESLTIAEREFASEIAS